MSATKTRPVIAPRIRRGRLRERPAASQPSSIEAALWAGSPSPLVVERPPAPPVVLPQPEREASGRTWWDWFSEAEHARAERLRPMWEMSPAQRVAAMRSGGLTYEQLAAWSARHPEQIPMLNGEFEWIAAKMPEVCE